MMPHPAKKQRGVFEHPSGSGVWWIHYHDECGTRHREKVGMKSTAIEMYRKRKDEIRRGKFEASDIKGKHINYTLKEIIKDYLIQAQGLGRRSFKDMKQRADFWMGCWGDRPVKSIQPADIELVRHVLNGTKKPGRWHKRRAKRRAPATVNRYLSILRAVFNLAITNDKLDKTPFRGIKMARENNERMRYLTEEEESRLCAAVPTEYHPLMMVALHTGMRWSEQVNLRWDDIDFRQEIIAVQQSKSGRKRYIPMNPLVVQVL